MIYGPDEQFPIGGSKVVRQSDRDQVTVVGAGITLHEALKAADQLQGEGVAIRVIDAYSVKPIDAKTLHAAAQATNGRIVVVEDHWFEGGLGDAVLDAFAGTEAQAPGGDTAARAQAGGASDAWLGDAGAGDQGRRNQREPHRRGSQVAAGVNAGMA